MEGEEVPGLEALSGDRFVARVGEAFSSGWERLDERAWEGDGAFQIETGPRHLLVIMHNVPQEAANRLIDIGREFGCKLYDPQIRYRFEG